MYSSFQGDLHQYVRFKMGTEGRNVIDRKGEGKKL